MQYMCALIAVKDIEASKRFYTGLLGRKIVGDLGANVVLEGGIALQTLGTWAEFISRPKEDIKFGGKQSELVFEEEDFDGFLQTLAGWPEVEKLHDVREYAWGQRVVRVLDPDGHVVEIGENMKVVVKRFFLQGMGLEEVSRRTMMPEFAEMCQKELQQEGKL